MGPSIRHLPGQTKTSLPMDALLETELCSTQSLSLGPLSLCAIVLQRQYRYLYQPVELLYAGFAVLGIIKPIHLFSSYIVTTLDRQPWRISSPTKGQQAVETRDPPGHLIGNRESQVGRTPCSETTNQQPCARSGTQSPSRAAAAATSTSAPTPAPLSVVPGPWPSRWTAPTSNGKPPQYRRFPALVPPAARAPTRASARECWPIC
ncbi:hypothetical protein MAPG_07675 [Magnaporthiopsis poae ATCC 64411]|uniref:Uncharacterized protein n=1 Tax=Magnaporthiopsis poae (strain ATCC 64411 / 73-15) TaxID=644358 RepID=A0A0C4E5A9_MAGP6|nr:hypothetical protein MAPG_07675 [Magnaporthiopsis poae ATCC 64411]